MLLSETFSSLMRHSSSQSSLQTSRNVVQENRLAGPRAPLGNDTTRAPRNVVGVSASAKSVMNFDLRTRMSRCVWRRRLVTGSYPKFGRSLSRLHGPLHLRSKLCMSLHRSRPASDVLSPMLRAPSSQLGDVHCIFIPRTQTARTDSALPDHCRSLADVPAGAVLRRARCSQVHQTGVRALFALRLTRLRFWSRMLSKLWRSAHVRSGS